jgi:hypothetical protein
LGRKRVYLRYFEEGLALPVSRRGHENATAVHVDHLDEEIFQINDHHGAGA